MSIRQTRIKLVARIFRAIGAEVLADLGDAFVRRAHECPDSFRIGIVKNVDYCGNILETHRLQACFFLGHMIYAKELIVAKEDSIHGHGTHAASTDLGHLGS
jgi:hypothetical protein